MKFESTSNILELEENEEEKSPEMSRRSFLRLSAFTAISAGTAITAMSTKKLLWDKAKNFFGNRMEELSKRKNNIGKEIETEKIMKSEVVEDGEILRRDIDEKNIVKTPTIEQVEIKEQDTQSLKEILDFDKEKIDLNLETYKSVEAYWKEKYSEDEGLSNSLKNAYREMGAWEEDLKKEFKKEGVPEKYIYLAIPESHWVLHARSKVGAAGPYQFIRRTAKKRGLETGTHEGEHKNVDERMDPILSAGACARELKYLYHKCDEDWELALSAYNGGFFWKYKAGVNYKNENGEKIKANYEDFMEYLEDKINKLMAELKSNNFHHAVRKGDTLSKIAKKYYVDLSALTKENNLSATSIIHKNQEIKIPVGEKNARKIYENMIAGYSENLNYPAKFNAVISLIEEGTDVMQKPDLKFKILKIKNEVGSTHKLAKGETFYSLHKKYKISVAEIKKANSKLNPNKIRLGTSVVIPNKKKPITLFDVALDNNISLERLKSLNTSIINYKKPLPDGFEVRM